MTNQSCSLQASTRAFVRYNGYLHGGYKSGVDQASNVLASLNTIWIMLLARAGPAERRLSAIWMAPWVAALIKKLAETSWQMWDHRNAVNTNNETAMASLEINNRIRTEFTLGFRTLDQEARRLARSKRMWRRSWASV